MNIDVDGPTTPRATIKFRNIPHGLFVSEGKLYDDAKKLRRAARLLQAAGGEEFELARWLLAYADMCQNAACGMEALIGMPYDRDVSRDYVPAAGVEHEYGD